VRVYLQCRTGIDPSHRLAFRSELEDKGGLTVNQANIATSRMKLLADLSVRNIGRFDDRTVGECVTCCVVVCALLITSLTVRVFSTSGLTIMKAQLR
jgi:hypothetical protein